MDDCVDPSTGEIAAWALEIIARLDTRTMFSSSGTGLHCVGYGTKTGTRCQNPKMFNGGIYSQFRFIALTDDVVPGCPNEIRDCQEALNSLYHDLFPEPRRQANGRISPGDGVDDYGKPKSPRMTDRAIFNKIANARNAEKFRLLWLGDDSLHQGDTSSADAAFLAQIAFYTQNTEQVVRIARQSDRDREKWDREDYLRRTLDFVLSQPGERYRADENPKTKLVLHPDGSLELVKV